MRALEAIQKAAQVNGDRAKAEQARLALAIEEEEKEAALWFERVKPLILERIEHAASKGRTSVTFTNWRGDFDLPTGWHTLTYQTPVLKWLRGLGYGAHFYGHAANSFFHGLEVDWNEV
jgi:hypothetical protein